MEENHCVPQILQPYTGVSRAIDEFGKGVCIYGRPAIAPSFHLLITPRTDVPKLEAYEWPGASNAAG